MNLEKALKIWPHADPRELVRFAEKVDDSGRCWVWTAHLHPKTGYGTLEVKRDGKWAPRTVHQLSYEWSRGKSAPRRHSGFHLDHKPVCRTRHCVRPYHIRKVRVRVNTVENSTGLTAQNARKTHCPKGHPYDEANTYVTPAGGRVCRKCQRKRSREWKQKVGY